MYTITKSPQKENPPIKQEQIKASAIIMREATVTIVVCCLCPFCSHSLHHACPAMLGGAEFLGRAHVV